MESDWDKQRETMVTTQLIPRGINSPAILAAMRAVPRHLFVPQSLRSRAYEDSPLPIAQGQTISQPYIVALMVQQAHLNSDSVVLDVGTGSGYAAAVVSRIVKKVYSVDRLPGLVEAAEKLIKELDYDNIECMVGDGSLGCPSKAPFDRIIVTAGAPVVPLALITQLTPHGELIIPVGDSLTQRLMRIRKGSNGEVLQEIIDHVRFVPLIGEDAW